MLDPITPALEAIRRECMVEGGTVADYIPQLALAAPERFGIALASLDGAVYSAGDADCELTIQSVSKPFVHALALEDIGLEAFQERIGAEPSGEPFNAITLEPGTGRPANPLINAGAILTTSLVGEFERIASCLSEFAGRALALDEAVYASERDTGDRNRAIAYLMRSAGSLRTGAEQAVDAYFRQCSLLVTARDLAVMAATLAHGGRNPVTGRRVVREETARHVLSVMAMCGMYDGAGQWMLRVGLPAKSGVSGGLLAVSPGQFGIGLFSPPLDARGNSVRGVLACERMSERLGLHLLHDPAADARSAKVAIRGRAPRSARRRSRAQRAELERRADAIAVLALRGDVDFAAAELALALTRDWRGGWLVLDLADVTRVHPMADALLSALMRELPGAVAVVSADDWPAATFADLPAALEWCEDDLLAPADDEVPLAAHDLAEAVDPSVLHERRFAAGAPLLDGDDDAVLAVQSGRVATFDAHGRRVLSVGAGGILSLLDLAGGRSARAEIPTRGGMLTRDAIPPGLWRTVGESLAAG